MKKRKMLNELARFWSKVSKSCDVSACWEWTGSINESGYGKFRRTEGDTCYAHRFAKEMVDGPIEEGMCVLHSCDNPKCVNPAHLFIGTKADNVKDMDAKGRSRRAGVCGEQHGMAKLDESDVKTIRAMKSDGESSAYIAGIYGVCKDTICKIVSKRTWSHI